MHWLQDLLKQHPPQPPAVTIDPQDRHRGAAVHRRHDRQSEGRDAHALQPDRGAVGRPWPRFRNLQPGKEVVLAFLPFFHIYGQVVIMLNSLCQGTCWCCSPAPTPEAIIAAMERYQATVFYGVPTLYEYLKDHKDTDKANWKRLKLDRSRAPTRCTSRRCSGWTRRTGSKITEGYGLSETAAISHINPLERPKTGSFGCPVPSWSTRR